MIYQYGDRVGLLCYLVVHLVFVFFEQKTAYEVRISDWSSDVCSSDLAGGIGEVTADAHIPEDAASRGVEAGDPGGPRVHRNDDLLGVDLRPELGRASCRERVCQYV